MMAGFPANIHISEMMRSTTDFATRLRGVSMTEAPRMVRRIDSRAASSLTAVLVLNALVLGLPTAAS